ncbi:MAG: tetratricopeptide repeat protein [Acidimicrobiaceae bacterium]|nr:tetratricopeptide repeat protein [Acidimicrobiaceae bacterium]
MSSTTTRQSDNALQDLIELAEDGIAACEGGDYPRAVALLDAALGLADERDVEPGLIATLCNELGMACKYAGEWDAGETALRRALALITELHGETSEEVAGICHNLGGLFRASGRWHDAEPWARRAVEVRQACNGDQFALVQDRAALAPILQELGRLDEAESLMTTALPFYEQQLGPDHLEVGYVLSNLGTVALDRDDLASATVHLQRALQIKQQWLGHDHPSTQITQRNLTRAQPDGA